jgi:2'-5' RNA ligase
MGSNLVIVAIPDENDRVWKVSSEKVPHLTLLFLGEAEKVKNAQQIVEFVEHAAATMLNRFYLSVDRRDKLGADEADVLFFRKAGYDVKAVREFRNALLKDTNIKTAYDSAEQFEGWTPHLTLGYPETPAKEIPDNESDRFYDVSFNKIAVWMGDSEGPEFLLKDYWDEIDALESVPMDVAMSSLSQNDIRVQAGMQVLEHYGTKGMKWGVRKADSSDESKRPGIQKFLDPQGHELSNDIAKTAAGVIVPVVAPLTWPAQIRLVRSGVRAAKAKSLDTQEKKFAKHAMKPQTFVAIHNGAVHGMNHDVEKINAKYPNPAKDTATQKKYDNEVLKSMQSNYKASANSLVNKANTMHMDVEFKNDGTDFVIHARQGPGKPVAEETVKHAVEDVVDEEITVEIPGKIKRDSVGHIVDFDFQGIFDDALAQTAIHGAAFAEGLMHYGVKGMHWGQRSTTPSAVAPKATSRVPSGDRRKTKIQAEGGQNHPAHHDAIKVAEAKVKLAKSGPAALSNQELRDVATRVQLEQQVKQLVTPSGKRFVKSLLGQQGNQAAQQVVSRQVKRKLATAALL